MIKDIKRGFKNLLYAFSIYPLGSLFMLILSLSVGPIHAMATKQTGVLVNSISENISTDRSEIYHILLLIALLAVLGFCISLASRLIGAVTKNKLEMFITENALQTMSRVPYLRLISEEYQDTAAALLNMLSMNMSLGIESLVTICMNGALFLSYAFLLYHSVGLFPLIGGVTVAILTSIIRAKTTRESYESIYKTIPYVRKQRYLDSLFYSAAPVAEMILFGSKKRLQELYLENMDNLSQKRWSIDKRDLKRNIILQGVVTAVTSLILLLIIMFAPATDNGQVVVLFSSFFALLSSGIGIGEGLASVNAFCNLMKQYQEYQEAYIDENDGQLNTETTTIANNEPIEEISLVDVGFSYNENSILHHVNMTIPQGTKVAIVGENGAGKTTLMQIILGLIPCSGSVKVNGMDAYIARKEGKNPIVSVMQNFGHYNGLSIKENITFGDPLLNSTNQIDPFFADLDMDETVGDSFGGRNYSGGQWQKIALARCTNSQARVVILDEPTAALDPVTEVDIFKRFMELNEGKTCILVSHRLGAIRDADKIYVLKNGTIYEQGTHDELMKMDGYYSQMFKAQAKWYSYGCCSSEEQCDSFNNASEKGDR